MSSPCSTFRVFRGKNRNNKQNTPNLSPLQRSEKQETNYADTIGQHVLKHKGRMWCDGLALERHTWAMD